MLNPVSVSDYISLLNNALSQIRVKVIGEIAEMKIASSGHVYFSLKDEKTGDIINCALWNSVYRMCGVEIKDGMKVILSGSVDIYRVRGTLTFKVKTIEHAGEGELRKAYEELKLKLTKEGIFEDKRKRDIPLYPQKIGIITSKKGAAIHDFINNLGKFGFKIYVCDSRVEGQEAVKDLLRSIEIMKEKDLDVLAIIRGGGSLQSLMAFDNEMLVRAISDFPVPVIAGIGHHEDITLCALAADAAESTPTAVAGRLERGFQGARELIHTYEKNIQELYYHFLYAKKESIYSYTENVKDFFALVFRKYEKSKEEIENNLLKAIYILRFKKDFIKNKEEKIKREFSLVFAKKNEELKNAEELIFAHDPRKQLKKGYSVVRKNGKAVKSTINLKKGDFIDTIFYDGEIESQIKNIKNKYYE